MQKEDHSTLARAHGSLSLLLGSGPGSAFRLYRGYIGIMEKKMETTIIMGYMGDYKVYIVVILGLYDRCVKGLTPHSSLSTSRTSGKSSNKSRVLNTLHTMLLLASTLGFEFRVWGLGYGT